jgi:hypothetical protein
MEESERMIEVTTPAFKGSIEELPARENEKQQQKQKKKKKERDSKRI